MAGVPKKYRASKTITKKRMQKGSKNTVTRASRYTCDILDEMLDARHCMFKNPRPPPLAGHPLLGESTPWLWSE